MYILSIFMFIVSLRRCKWSCLCATLCLCYVVVSIYAVFVVPRLCRCEAVQMCNIYNKSATIITKNLGNLKGFVCPSVRRNVWIRSVRVRCIVLFFVFCGLFSKFFFLWIDFASTASPVSDNYVLWHYFGTFLNFRLDFFCCCCLGYIHFCMSTSNNNTHNNGNAETQLRSIPQWKMVIVFRFLWKEKKYGHHKKLGKIKPK